MFCTKCGKEISEGANFCTGCGAAVSGEADKAALSDDKTIILTPTNSSSDFAVKKEESVVTNKRVQPIVFFVIAGAVALFFLILTITGVAIYNSPQWKYERQLSLGAKYLDELDYERAVAVYKTMLEIDPQNEEVQELLENAYIAWAESEPEKAADIYNEAIAYMDTFEGDGKDAMQSEFENRISQISTFDQTDTTDGNSTTPAEKSSFNLKLTIVSASSEDGIPGAEVALQLKNGATTDTKNTENSGDTEFDNLNPGIYSVSISADGYNCRDIEINIDNDETILIALAPIISGDDACVLVEWDGTMDVDLCAFNANLQEYIDAAHVTDSANDVFLYDINSADEGYELLYMHNFSSENVRSIYVLDRKAAQNGTSSGMESDGVRICVYTAEGEIYRSTADSSENAPLWSPCYIYAGEVYELSDYIYDLIDYKWVGLSEEDQVVDQGVPESEWKQAYYNAIKDMSDYEFDAIALGYVDDDNVPELFLQYTIDMQVYSYKDGKVYSDSGDVCGGSYFISRSGLIMYYCAGGDYSGEYYYLARLTQDGFTDIADGDIYRSVPAWENSNKPYGNYNWVKIKQSDERWAGLSEDMYEAYYWNGVSYPSWEDYYAAMNKEFDFSKASDYSRTFNSYKDLVKYLSE